MSERWITDDFGNCWMLCADPDCSLQIVRPGKVQCNGEFDKRAACPDYKAALALAAILNEEKEE